MVRLATLAAAAITITLVVGPSYAELAVFVDGRVLRVEDAHLVGDDIHLILPGGGRLEIPAERIDRVVDDEIIRGGESEDPYGNCPAGWVDDSLPSTVPFAALIGEAARSADLNPRLLAALVRAESAFDPLAVSRVGARGLTQLMPSAAADHGVSDPFDPADNLRGGAAHLRLMLDRFDSLPLALAAYNAGAATVDRYGGVPPYRETRGFLSRILGEFCGG